MTYIRATKNKKIVCFMWTNSTNLGDLWLYECMKTKFPGIVSTTTEETDFSKYDFVILGPGGLLNGPMLRAPFDKPMGTKYGSISLGGEFEITDAWKYQEIVLSYILYKEKSMFVQELKIYLLYGEIPKD